MEQSHIRLMSITGKDTPFHEIIKGKKKTVRYNAKIKLERRRPLAGRPQGTECGNSCTCS